MKVALSNDYSLNRRTIGRKKEILAIELSTLKERGERSIIKPQTSWGGMGTLEKVDCKIKCAEKSCYSDPLPVRDMHITIPAGETSGPGSVSGLDAHYCAPGSGKNETIHNIMNRLLQNISRVRSETLQMRIKLRIYRFNYGIDTRPG